MSRCGTVGKWKANANHVNHRISTLVLLYTFMHNVVFSLLKNSKWALQVVASWTQVCPSGENAKIFRAKDSPGLGLVEFNQCSCSESPLPVVSR